MAAPRHDRPPTRFAARAPGRVNLIGEHTDYTGGLVLPMAIDRGTTIEGVRTPGGDTVELTSADEPAPARIPLPVADLAATSPAWGRYVAGVAAELGPRATAIRARVTTDLPIGAGLSSSAALEVAASLAMHPDPMPVLERAQLCRRAEHRATGVPCGIMDQLCCAAGVEGHALLIDCRSLDYQRVPFPDGASLVIGNTKASRSLANSAYNERRAQCEEGVTALQAVLPGITALRDVTNAQLEEHKALLSPIVYRRCRHVVGENERVMATVAALAAGDLEEVGRLMNASHESLRYDYEVSSDALDAMVEAMRSAPGCLGARLTGAGFGGCAVALVARGHERAVRDAILDQYAKAMSIWPEVYTSPASAGARVFSLTD